MLDSHKMTLSNKSALALSLAARQTPNAKCTPRETSRFLMVASSRVARSFSRVYNEFVNVCCAVIRHLTASRGCNAFVRTVYIEIYHHSVVD